MAFSTLLCAALWIGIAAPRARADEMGQTLQQRPFNMIYEGGYRYPFGGQGRIPGDGFPATYHAAVTSLLGFGGTSGLYLSGRVDGYGPRGRGLPLVGQLRVGYFANVHQYEQAAVGTTTSRNTQCGSIWCTTTETTRLWYEPPGWVSGVTYFYAGYHQGFQLLGDFDPRAGVRELAYPGAVSVGVGNLETKFATYLNEVELLYWPFGWTDEDRSKWGFQYRGALLLGPVFLDFTFLLDAALGGEVSLGLGFMITP